MDLEQALKDNLENMLVKNIEALNACEDIKPDRKIFALHSAISSLETLTGKPKVSEVEKVAEPKQAQINFPEKVNKCSSSRENLEQTTEMKRLRQVKKMTQDELAYRTGISQNQISKYERGLVQPHFAFAKRIAKELGFTGNPLSLFTTNKVKSNSEHTSFNNLLHLRTKNNLRQADVEDVAGIQRGVVSLLEHRKLNMDSPVTLTFCQKLAEVFGWQGDPLTLLDEYKGEEQ